jgi:methionine synthase II (cobalamin-independent)
VPVELLTGGGAAGVLVDHGVLDPEGHDAVAEALEQGSVLALGVVPALALAAAPSDKQVIDQVLRWLDMVGLDPATVSDRLAITPSCGLAGADAGWVRTAVALTTAVARRLDP